jgi:hypothetical protein
VFVREAENACEAGFSAMSKVPWGTLQHVGDQSEYATTIGTTLKPIIGTIRGIIRNPKYFRTFCDKFIEYVLLYVVVGKNISYILTQELYYTVQE